MNKTNSFNILTLGIGGEGVLLSGVIIARAANLEGYFVTGLQLHGLAQRGGSIPVFVRLGNVHAPTIPRGRADLILAFEPSEALRYAKYGFREKTIFIIDDKPVKSLYSEIANEYYPTTEEIKQYLKPFAKSVYFVDAAKECEKRFGSILYSNTMMIGIAHGCGLIPIKKENIIKALDITVKYGLEQNIEAFKVGVEKGKSLR